jgi:uncharacterized membrane protein
MTWPLSFVPAEWAAEPPAVTAEPRVPLREQPWPRLIRALGLLATSGASLGLGITTLLLFRDAELFVAKNILDMPNRMVLVFGVLGGLVAFPLAALVWLLLSRGRATGRILRAANLLSPLTLTALGPPLFAFRAWQEAPLSYLCVLAVAVLLAEHLFTRALSSMPDSLTRWADDFALRPFVARWLPALVVLSASVAYAIYFSHYTILNHQRFQTGAFDLGINVNWCYNALNGEWFRSTVLYGPDGGHFLANHAIYAMFIWLPLYALQPGAEVLLVYQAVMCGVAAIPLYMFAARLIPRPAALIVALAYLLYAPLHGPNFYDYHELPVALPFHFLLYWAIASEKTKLVPPLVLILFAHREDIPIGLAILGFFLLASGVRPRLGGLLALASSVFFVVNRFVIMPSFGNWWFASIYKDLQPEGVGGFGGIVQTLLINPAYFLSTLLEAEKLTYALHLFAPLVFLPARRLGLLFLAIPGFFLTLMTTGYAPTISIAFQYTTHWIPYLFAAAVIALKLLRESSFGRARQWGAVLALAVGVLSHSTLYGAVIQHETFVGGFSRVEFEMSADEKKAYAGFRRLADQIPSTASVAATDNLIAHVAARMDIYSLNGSHGNADYLLVRHGDGSQAFRDAFTKNTYGLVDEQDGFYLFKKNAVTAANLQKTTEAKQRFGIP